MPIPPVVREWLEDWDLPPIEPEALGDWAPDLRQIRERFDVHADDLRRISSADGRMRATLAFVYKPDLNAIVFEAEPGHIGVGLHFGAVIQLRDTFNRLLSHPSVFPEIGDASVERERRIPFLLVHDHVRRATGTPVEPVFPVDPERRAFAGRCYWDAIDFLLLHELSHAWRGHLRYLKRRVGMAEHAESGPRAARLTELQALECDADQLAGAHFLATLGDEPGADGAHRRPLRGAFAIQVLFFIMHQAADAPVHTHPHPQARARLVRAAFQVLSDQLAAKERAEWARLIDAADDGFLRAQRAWSELGWPIPPVDFERELNLVLDDRAALVDKLQPFLRTPLVDDASRLDTSGLDVESPPGDE